MNFDKDAKFPSSLVPNATVSWSCTSAQTVNRDNSSASVDLSVAFPAADLDFLQRIYGWAALQYQAWARGFLYVDGDESRTVVLFTDNVLEFHVNGTHHFGGDFYAFRKAPLVLQLDPGNHTIDIRLIRDVRAMGGVGDPTIDVQLEARLSSPDLQIATDKALMPDIVDGKLASTLGSIQVRNDGMRDMDILSVSANDTSYFVWLLQPGDFRIVAGQTRPVSFVISCNDECNPYLQLEVEYRIIEKRRDRSKVLRLSHQFEQKASHEPLKVTFYHPGAMVSYAIVRPPPANRSCPVDPDGLLPVLLLLHGAGLEADNDIARHAMDPLPDLCAWILIPTGSTPWSGDDWHTWGFADVEAAIAAIPGWIDNIGWVGPGANTNRWLVSGHSNGGE